MIETNVTKYLGFCDDLNVDEFQRVYKLFELDLNEMPMSITMLTSLLKTPTQVI